VNVTTTSTYSEGDSKSATSNSNAVKYYTNGGAPTISAITDNGNNTFKITGTVGANGVNNNRSGTTLYYTTDGSDASSSSTRTTASITVSNGSFTSSDISIPARTTDGNTTIKALVVSTFPWGTTEALKTKSATKNNGAVQYHTNVGIPNVVITDNGNNTFTIKGTAGGRGVNNTPTTSYTWGYTNSYGNTDISGEKHLAVEAATASRTVYAKATTTGTWENNTTKYKEASLPIKNYQQPYWDATNSWVSLHNDSLKNGKLTIKKNWKYTWGGATKQNGSSPIVGYHIRIHRKANGASSYSPILGLTGSTSNNTISKGSGTDNYVDRASTSTTIEFNPVDLGFAPGDYIKVSIWAYTKDGTGTQKWGDPKTSEEKLVRNAGVVRVKTAGGWKEGQVWVKTTEGWKEAETVYAKTANGWKEST
jgi:hypothetical protein